MQPLGDGTCIASLAGSSCWHGIFGANFINAIVPRNCAPKTCQAVCKCIALLAGSKAKRAGLRARVFQDKFNQCDCAEKLCAQDLSSGVLTLGDGTCIALLAGSKAKRAEPVGTGFSGQIPSMRLCRETVRPRLAKRRAATGRWDMHSFVGRERREKCAAVGTVFSGQISSMRLCRETVRPRLVKRCANA